MIGHTVRSVYDYKGNRVARIVDEGSNQPSLFSKQLAENTVQTDLIGPVDFKVLTEPGRDQAGIDLGVRIADRLIALREQEIVAYAVRAQAARPVHWVEQEGWKAPWLTCSNFLCVDRFDRACAGWLACARRPRALDRSRSSPGPDAIRG